MLIEKLGFSKLLSLKEYKLGDEIMLKKVKMIFFVATLLLGISSFISFGHVVNADEAVKIDSNDTEVITEIKELSKDELIIEFAKNSNMTKEEAEKMLFPATTVRQRSIQAEESRFAVVRASFQDRIINDSVDGGTVYFYCETSESGWFRGIKRIIYAGYNHPRLGFKGTLQYALPDANRIHFTLNGSLHHHATTSISGGGSIGVGGLSSFEIGMSISGNFAKNVFVNKNISF